MKEFAVFCFITGWVCLGIAYLLYKVTGMEKDEERRKYAELLKLNEKYSGLRMRGNPFDSALTAELTRLSAGNPPRSEGNTDRIVGILFKIGGILIFGGAIIWFLSGFGAPEEGDPCNPAFTPPPGFICR